MANKDAAFGLKPIGKVGQNRDNMGLSEYSIAANTSDDIYFNEPVRALATGTVGAANVSAVALLGSLNGVFYTDTSTKNQHGQITTKLQMLRLILLRLFLTTRMKDLKYNLTMQVLQRKLTFSTVQTFRLLQVILLTGYLKLN